MKEKNRKKFNFENLMVYSKSMEYISFVYKLTSKFPKSETHGLTSQFNRAATSIALNIGEGSAGTANEFRNFIRISYRSLNECVVCTSIASIQNYITLEEEEKSREDLLEITRMLSGLRNSIKEKTK